ncbi:MAG TPA: RNA polymerase sigma factor [Solirubrobacter sp.]|nr:RNA polymerase sigma factor [Solirubrobacter sp.]
MVFREVFEAHHAEIRRYLVNRAGDAAVGEELASETFARAFAASGRFSGAVRPWLFAIATNVLRDELRARRRRLALLERLRGERPPVVALAPVVPGDPELAAALATLRRDELDVLLLHAWAELTYEEIAAALDLPIGTVRSRLSRARARLRSLLPERSPVR